MVRHRKIGERLHTLIVTERTGRTRIIGLRKAKQQDLDYYENKAHSSDT